MRCWPSPDLSLRTALSAPPRLCARTLAHWLVILAALWLALAAPVRAALIEPLDARISLDEDEVLLAAAFDIDLGARLEDALTRGVTLGFRLECVIERPREYWFPEHIAAYAQNYRLGYSSLTRQYRLSIGSLHQSFATLPDALRALGRVGALPVAERTLLRPATRYDAAVRLTLDASQLPKPFQLDALTSNAWKVESHTRRWSFSTP